MVHLRSSLNPLLVAAASVVACVLVSDPARAIRVVVPCGRDATLFESCGCYASGAGSALFSGQTQFFGARRALLWFAVEERLPVRAHVDSARLELHTDHATPGARVHTLHRVLADWGEGTSVSPGGGGVIASSGDATWTHSFYDVKPWASPGGDYEQVPCASASVDDLGAVRWGSTTEMVANVQLWLDNPQTNYGWVLIGEESADQSAKRFASRENGTVDQRPVLIVDYTPPSAVESRTWSSIKSLYAPRSGAMSTEGRP